MKPSINISVVIPTYNRNLLLKRAIKSVLTQTFQPYEIIVIDDGSKDETQNSIKSDFPQIKYFWQYNSGISSARNHGIKKSSGNWIAFLDSDDEWLPKKLEMQVAAIKKHPKHQVFHTNEYWIRKGKRVNPKEKHQKYGGFIFEKCLPLCVISPSSVVIKKQVFNDFGLFDTSLPACEDYDMWLRICAFLQVYYLETPLINKYGGHADQLSNKYWGMDRFRIIALEKIINNNLVQEKFRIAALKTLLEKLNIFINGSKKRGKFDNLTEEFISKLNKYKSISF